MSSNKDVDEARATEWPVYHWDKVEHSDDHGPIARSGTSKKNPKIDDAKPVKPPDAVKKLKKDIKEMMRRIEQEEGKGRKRRKRTRGKKRRKTKRRKRNRKKSTRRRKRRTKRKKKRSKRTRKK